MASFGAQRVNTYYETFLGILLFSKMTKISIGAICYFTLVNNVSFRWHCLPLHRADKDILVLSARWHRADSINSFLSARCHRADN